MWAFKIYRCSAFIVQKKLIINSSRNDKVSNAFSKKVCYDTYKHTKDFYISMA